jgi:glycogen(starch) synthase
MRVLHLAWEYPPVLYGGLGRHVHALARAQAAAGHDVVVVTQAPVGSSPGEGNGAGPDAGWHLSDEDGLRVLRVAIEPPGALEDLLARVADMEHEFAADCEAALATWRPEVVHAHDWMVAHAGVRLRAWSGAPLVATIHATEAGRNAGWVTSQLSTTIHGVEWWLANTADLVIACSLAMAGEVTTLFGVSEVRVIPNGIDLRDWQVSQEATQRVREAHADADPLLVYTGRVEHEKGVQTILAALPELRERHPAVRLLVAGRGSHLPVLQQLARELGLTEQTVRFLGWVSEQDLRAIVAAADLVIVPSLYEPFGLVALEATALGAPLVLAQTGGLAEFARGGSHALLFRPGDPQSLAAAVAAGLTDRGSNRVRATRATAALAARHDWATIAQATVGVYREAAVRAHDEPYDGEVDGPPGTDSGRPAAPPQLTAPLGRLLEASW